MRRTVLVAILVTTLAPLRAAAQFTPFDVALGQFDARVAAGVAEDAGGAVSIAVF